MSTFTRCSFVVFPLLYFPLLFLHTEFAVVFCYTRTHIIFIRMILSPFALANASETITRTLCSAPANVHVKMTLHRRRQCGTMRWKRRRRWGWHFSEYSTISLTFSPINSDEGLFAITYTHSHTYVSARALALRQAHLFHMDFDLYICFISCCQIGSISSDRSSNRIDRNYFEARIFYVRLLGTSKRWPKYVCSGTCLMYARSFVLSQVNIPRNIPSGGGGGGSSDRNR